ncbi:MAG TPA: hypothetical protein VHO06_06570 [Polyangia bacterium]|nr:hypothetical protein [Polyangia bacterium]
MRLEITRRLSFRGDAGASFRHIGIDGEVENTVFGFTVGGGCEVMVLERRGWELGAIGTFRAVHARAGENFWVDVVGIGAAIIKRW